MIDTFGDTFCFIFIKSFDRYVAHSNRFYAFIVFVELPYKPKIVHFIELFILFIEVLTKLLNIIWFSSDFLPAIFIYSENKVII